MRRLTSLTLVTALAACGPSSSSGAESTSGAETTSGGETTASTSGNSGAGEAGSDAAEDGSLGEFQLHDSDTAGAAHGDHPTQIEATRTEAAMRFFVVDPDAGPIVGTVIKMTGPDGRAFYTGETDSVGYAEVLVPAGARYQLEYLSLGRRTARASVNVRPGPNQDIRLTLRRHGWHPPPRPAAPEPEPGQPAPEPEPEVEHFVLEGVLFATGRATIQDESFPRLDRVVEYMMHKPDARIRISGHTDNVGDPTRNQQLSEQRAEAVRTYLTEHGIDGGRVEAVGYGDQRPVASNDTEEGRSQNRRIEAIEL